MNWDLLFKIIGALVSVIVIVFALINLFLVSNQIIISIFLVLMSSGQIITLFFEKYRFLVKLNKIFTIISLVLLISLLSYK